METIQKLSTCLLTVRHVLSKKGQQSFLCIGLPIFTFAIQLEELGRRFKSLDPHFVLSLITEDFRSVSVLSSFLSTSLVCREHKADNLETDPNCALQTKASLCVILASCMLSICSTANFAKAQNCPVESKGWQTVLLLTRDNTLFFSASKRLTGSKYEELKQTLGLLRKLQSFSTVLSNCFICCSWCPLLAITSSKL